MARPLFGISVDLGAFERGTGQRFPVQVKTLNGGALPSYFGFAKGISVLTSVTDHYATNRTKIMATNNPICIGASAIGYPILARKLDARSGDGARPALPLPAQRLAVRRDIHRTRLSRSAHSSSSSRGKMVSSIPLWMSPSSAKRRGTVEMVQSSWTTFVPRPT